MENINENEQPGEHPVHANGVEKAIEDGKDDATAGFANAEKDSAAEVNRGGDDKSRNYMNKKAAESRGPHWDKESKEADGDTSQNAGVFK